MRLCAFAPLREIKNTTLFEIIFLKRAAINRAMQLLSLVAQVAQGQKTYNNYEQMNNF